MSSYTVTPPICNITKDPSIEELEGCTQFLQEVNIQLNININQEHEELYNEELDQGNPCKEDPPAEIEDVPDEPEIEYGPVDVNLLMK